ncbi:MAG: hypothetical protein AAGP08_01520 [Pseudomonadota bacterium]
MTRFITFIAAALLAAPMAFAQSGSEGVFTISNITEGNIVIGFYTNDGSGWSDNWLSYDLEPGDSAQAEFFAETGSCAQTFQVGWLADDDVSEILDDPISIDICAASNVYLADNEIYYD